MHCLRLVQSLFDGLHVSRQEVVERLWVAYLLTHHTCLPIMCLLTPLLSIFVHTLVHTHTPLLLITMTKQRRLENCFQQPHSFVCAHQQQSGSELVKSSMIMSVMTVVNENSGYSAGPQIGITRTNTQ